MKRIQAFEFNEREEVPEFLRDSVVEILGNGLRWGRVMESAGPAFMDFCSRAGCGQVLDLCSGTGEPASALIRAIEKAGMTPPRFHLSDIFPSVEAMENIQARHPGKAFPLMDPVDATNVPEDVDCGACTIINALHHFPPEIALAIFADCVAKNRAVFILEGLQRTPQSLLALFPFLLASFFASPFLARKNKLLKFFFTYAVPIIGACGLWDAVVSMMRTHSGDELLSMARSMGASHTWEILEAPFSPFGSNIIFMGIPKKTDTDQRDSLSLLA